MPTYTYLCKNCDTEFDVEQKITDKVGARCQNCGRRTLNRLITCTNFVLKDGGSGWYKNGYSNVSSGSREKKLK